MRPKTHRHFGRGTLTTASASPSMAHAAAAANQLSAHRDTDSNKIRSTPGSAPPHPALPRNESNNIQIKNRGHKNKTPAHTRITGGGGGAGITWNPPGEEKKASSRGRGSGAGGGSATTSSSGGGGELNYGGGGGERKGQGTSPMEVSWFGCRFLQGLGRD